MADQLKRIADALDGGDPNMGKPAEGGNLKRIADYIVENGMGGGGSSEPIIITAYFNEHAYLSLDKTWQEIHDNFLAGKLQIVKSVSYADSENYTVSDDYGMVVGCREQISGYGDDTPTLVIMYINNNNVVTIYADTKDGYPGGDFS